jgi:Bacteriophage abortive infection AbiH
MNLFIIGNGFDLAHGMPTRYSDFLAWLWMEGRKDVGRWPRLFKDNLEDRLATIRPVEQVTNEGLVKFTKSPLLLRLYQMSRQNAPGEEGKLGWCDIEELYFDALKDSWKPKTKDFQPIGELNADFGEIKLALEVYLAGLEIPKLDIYHKLFAFFPERRFLTFNYTKTLEQYTSDKEGIIHLHGELNNTVNPPIFGYAPEEEVIREIRISSNRIEYSRWLKHTQYGGHDSKEALMKVLDENHDVNVFVLGHSCGKSDAGILSKIFTHPNTRSIKIFYYKDWNGFRETFSNIDAICDLPTDKSIVAPMFVSLETPNSGTLPSEEFRQAVKRFVSYGNNFVPLVDFID